MKEELNKYDACDIIGIILFSTGIMFCISSFVWITIDSTADKWFTKAFLGLMCMGFSAIIFRLRKWEKCEMKIELRELMSDNDMLSHIFLGCISSEQLRIIKEKYVGTAGNEIDWRKESVTIPIEMKIGGVSVNPRQFFDNWKDQMQELILEKAKELVAKKLGSEKIKVLQQKLYDYEQVLNSWEKEINWKVKNPLIDTEV